MLIEVKVKVVRIIDDKTRKRTETYLLNKEFFSEAEYKVTSELTEEQTSHLIESFEIQSLKISPLKEVCDQYQGDFTYIATLKDTFVAEDGTEKPIKYKILLWANSLSEAMSNTHQLVQQGYCMDIESIKEVNYQYLYEDAENQ